MSSKYIATQREPPSWVVLKKVQVAQDLPGNGIGMRLVTVRGFSLSLDNYM
jgi:predicted N-acetyltransferase YhbS